MLMLVLYFVTDAMEDFLNAVDNECELINDAFRRINFLTSCSLIFTQPGAGR